MRDEDRDFSHIQWDCKPASDLPALVPIYSASPQASQTLVILSDRVEGVWTHYYLERTIPCLGEAGKCICQNVTLSRRWKGYLGCWDPLTERICLAEITLDGYRLCPRLSSVAESLRGSMIRLYRAGKRANAPMRAELLRGAVDVDQLRPAFNVRDALMRIWLPGLNAAADE